MRVLLAPAPYRGTMTARQACEALAAGWRAGAPDDDLTLLPLSDGGAGLLDALATLPGAVSSAVTVTGPAGVPVPAEVLVVDGPAGRCAYVDAGAACGPELLPRAEWAPERVSSYGVGELVAAAVATGATQVVLGVGEVLCHDGGLGLWHALADLPAPDLQDPLASLVEVETRGVLARAAEALVDVEVVVATPADLPLLGLQGASAVDAPGRGATPDTAQALERRLADLVALVERLRPAPTDLLTGRPRRLDKAPGAGAGGGLAWGLAVLGGRVVDGAALVAGLVDLDARVREHDLLVTGEGRLDWASLRGRVASTLGEHAMRHVRPLVTVPGQSLVGRRETAAIGVSGIYPVAEGLRQVPASLADPAGSLSRRVERVARTWSRA